MNTPTSTQEHISRLIGFRQAVYTDIFQQRRDALFEMLDALLCGGILPSFACLSQHERFRRKWHSLYVAVEDGQIDTCALRQLLVQQFPQEGVCVFPLDSSCWSRPRSRVLEDLQYVYQASSAVNGGTVSIGYPYSLLEWCAEPHTSWSLPLDVRRMDSQHTAQDVGAEQVQALAQAREGCSQALDIVVAREKNRNASFSQSAQMGDTWTQLVVLADWMLLLARPVVQGSPLPWQKAQTRLPPQRVRQSLWTILMQIGAPVQPPKLRGKSPGWLKGRCRRRKERHKVVKKRGLRRRRVFEKGLSTVLFLSLTDRQGESVCLNSSSKS